MKPQKYCEHPGCRVLVDHDKRYCKKHQQTYNKAQYKQRVSNVSQKQINDFYNGTRWKKLSRLILEREPVCRWCWEHDHIIRPAQAVDHIKEVREAWSKRYDVDNLRPLCASCHRIRHNLSK